MEPKKNIMDAAKILPISKLTKYDQPIYVATDIPSDRINDFIRDREYFRGTSVIAQFGNIYELKRVSFFFPGGNPSLLYFRGALVHQMKNPEIAGHVKRGIERLVEISEETGSSVVIGVPDREKYFTYPPGYISDLIHLAYDANISEG